MAGLSGRVKRLERLVKEKGLEAVVVTDKNDIFYYTGFKPSESGFLVVGREPKLFVSQLDNEALRVSGARVVFYRRLIDIAKFLEGKAVGFDEGDLNAEIFGRLRRKVKLRKAGEIIKRPRLAKEPGEVEKIKKAVKVVGEVFGELEILGRRESDVEKQVLMGLLERGSGPAFRPLVASGSNAYFVHHRPGVRKIGKGDLVIVDMGARWSGYCSDITRMFCRKPGRREVKLMEDVKEMQARIIDRIEVGVKFREIQDYYRRLMDKKGYKVRHGFGHSVGLSVHEGFREVEAGMVMAVEPGVYIKGFGGCRVEDMVLVKKRGAEILSKGVRIGSA